jgi:hypothetical protein
MGRILLHDGLANRPIPANELDKTIEIDLGDEPEVTAPPGVEVRTLADAE